MQLGAIRRKIPVLATVLLIAMFAAQASYFAAVVNDETAPDEWFHVSASRIWASTEGFRIQDREGPETIQFGPLTYSPFVYHWLMGKTLRAVYAIEGESLDASRHVYFDEALKIDRARYLHDLAVIRWASVGLATLGFAFSAGFLFTSGASFPCVVVVLFFALTTLMYTFISGMANYDNLVVPIAMAAFWVLASLAREATPRKFLGLGILVLLGCLTKVVFLPLGAGLVVAAFLVGRKALATRAFWRPILRTPVLILSVVALLVLLRSGVRLYGANYVRFGAMHPTCEAVFGAEICGKEYSQTIRDQKLMASSAGQKRDRWRRYAHRYFKRLEETIVGVMGHRSVMPTQYERYPLRRGLSACLVAIAFALLKKREIFKDPIWWSALGISVFYGVTIVVENFDSYQRLGVFGAGIQGRYWFPVWVPLLFAFHKPLFSLLKPRPAAIAAAAFVALYSLQGFRIWQAHPEREFLMRPEPSPPQ